jgi:hypothetical protein
MEGCTDGKTDEDMDRVIDTKTDRWTDQGKLTEREGSVHVTSSR